MYVGRAYDIHVTIVDILLSVLSCKFMCSSSQRYALVLLKHFVSRQYGCHLIAAEWQYLKVTIFCGY